MKNKILVTGGAGYIGSHTIVELLKTEKYEVISIDNYINSNSLTYDRIRDITRQDFNFYKIDLNDYQKLKEIFEVEKNIEGIIHFAALKSVPESLKMPEKYYYNNTNSLFNILQLAEEYSVKGIVFSSTCSVYGNIKKLPVDESIGMGEAESPYSYSKQVCEKILERFTSSPLNKSYNSISLRYFNPIGAHMSGKLGETTTRNPQNLMQFLLKVANKESDFMEIYGDDYETKDGTCIRDFIHVSDLSVAHVRSLQYLFEKSKESNKYDVFNVGTGYGFTVKEAISTFEKVNNINIPIKVVSRRKGDIEKIFADNTKIKNNLDWDSQYSLSDMMESAWTWYKSKI